MRKREMYTDIYIRETCVYSFCHEWALNLGQHPHAFPVGDRLTSKSLYIIVIPTV